MSSPLPNPTSVVLEASHILHVRITSANVGEWSAGESGFLERSAKLVLELLEVFKGEVEAQPGEQLRLRVTQFSSGSERDPQAPGVWSNKALDEGAELICCCQDTGNRSAVELLQDHCLEVFPAEGEIDDVRLALQGEADNLSPAALLGIAEPHASELGYVFTRYLWAKVAVAALVDQKIFDQLMNFIELPTLSLIARWSLLNSVYSAVTRISPPPEALHSRLTVTMIRLIQLAPDPTVTDNIMQVFLPNLLGLQGGLSVRAADDIFRHYPEERTKLEEALRSYRGSTPTNDLLAWVAQGS